MDMTMVYEVVASEPELGCMTQLHSIRLQRITETDSTYITWQTEFSNGASCLKKIACTRHCSHSGASILFFRSSFLFAAMVMQMQRYR